MSDEEASPTLPSDTLGILTVDVEALVANWRWLSEAVAPAECAAVIKADAYGVGIERATPALAKAGCRTFFTAHVSEGVRARTSLRRVELGDQEVRVFVLNGFHPQTAPTVRWSDAWLRPVIGSAVELSSWFAAGLGAAGLGAALHVDTGMNRLGFPPTAAGSLDALTLSGAKIELLMSHFVAAEEPDNPFNARQVERFDALRRGPLGELPASLANSSGILLPSRPHYDLVRPGFALYGGNPCPGRPNPMRPVVSLHAPILQTRIVAAGETAGYGGLWIASRDSTLATIGIGYADGYPRNARTLGETASPVARIGDRHCPLVGRVSMDLILIDVTDANPQDVAPGALVELIGPNITVDDVGAACQTTGYEILTRLGRRYARP